METIINRVIVTKIEEGILSTLKIFNFFFIFHNLFMFIDIPSRKYWAECHQSCVWHPQVPT